MVGEDGEDTDQTIFKNVQDDLTFRSSHISMVQYHISYRFLS